EFRTFGFGLLVQILRVAFCPPRRQTGDINRLAPQGLQPLLEMEIPTWPSALTKGASSAHCRNGLGQPDLGPRAYRRRTLVETRHPSLAANGAGLLARRRSIDPVAITIAELEHLRTKPRSRAAG